MDVDREQIIQISGEFVRENRELLDDPFVSMLALEIAIKQAAAIGLVLSEETTSRMNEAADRARQIERDYREEIVKPVVINRMSKEHAALKNEYELYHEALKEFESFAGPLRRLYISMADREASET